jgi:hypothetical protein
MSKRDVKQQVTKEIIQAIGEIMSKYNLKCTKTEEVAYCDVCDDAVETFDYWRLQANQYKIEMEDIFVALQPTEYGKVKE